MSLPTCDLTGSSLPLGGGTVIPISQMDTRGQGGRWSHPTTPLQPGSGRVPSPAPLGEFSQGSRGRGGSSLWGLDRWRKGQCANALSSGGEPPGICTSSPGHSADWARVGVGSATGPPAHPAPPQLMGTWGRVESTSSLWRGQALEPKRLSQGRGVLSTQLIP